MSHSPIEGYEQVESLDSDDADEYEEEETLYITLDLGPTDPNLLLNSNSYRLIGLDTAQPFLQIGTSIFRGDYETLLGTEILLREPSNLSGPGSRSLVPMTTTEHRIRFKEVHLIPKDQATTAEDAIFEDDHSIKRTLGGVSREPRGAAFVPAVKSGKKPLYQGTKPKKKRRKRPEGNNTDDGKDAGQSKEADGRADDGTTDHGAEESGKADAAAPAGKQNEDSEDEEMEENDEDDEMMSQDAEGSDVE